MLFLKIRRNIKNKNESFPILKPMLPVIEFIFGKIQKALNIPTIQP